jgi:hypothetical protein
LTEEENHNKALSEKIKTGLKVVELIGGGGEKVRRLD